MSSTVYERLQLVATVDPDDYTTGAQTSDYVDMGKYNKALVVVAVGTIDTGGTWDAQVYQATDSSGTSAKVITGKAITQLTQAGSDADKQAVINVRSDELDVANSFDHIAIRITAAAGGGDAAAFIFAEPRSSTQADLTSVDEVVN